MNDLSRMTRDDVLPASYQECFGCGDDNGAGIGLKDIRRDDDVVRATLMPQRHHQGFPGILHGAIVMGALDEAMSYACALIGGAWSATAKVELRFRRPLFTDRLYHLEAGIESHSTTRRFHTWSRIRDEAEVVCAEATALFMAAPEAMLGDIEPIHY